MSEVKVKSIQELNNIIQDTMKEMFRSEGYKNNFKDKDYLKNGRAPYNTEIILILSTGQRIKGSLDIMTRRYKASRVNFENETPYSIHKLDIHPYVVGWEEIKKVYDGEKVYS